MAPLSLPQWIQRAKVHLSNEEYLECAIIVASELTNCLIRVAGTDTNTPQRASSVISSTSLWNELANFGPEEKNAGGFHSSLHRFQIEEIVPENVVVFVSKKKNLDRSSPANFRAVDVNIQSRNSESEIRRRQLADTPHTSQRDLCFALGKILFEIFSESCSMFLNELSPHNNDMSIKDLQIEDFDPNNGENSEDAANIMGAAGLNDEQDDSDDIFALPALKKAFLFISTEPMTLAKSMKANEYLQAQALPPSIIQLVCDLLDAEEGNPYIANTAIMSLEEAQRDLQKMKSFPERLLDSHSCPKKALDKTALFNQSNAELYGREKELSALMNMSANICQHMSSLQNAFLCEAAFISGHSGSGKSSLTRQIALYCNAIGWSVIYCKFDRKVAPLSILIQSFDAYFGKFIPNQIGGIVMERDPSLQETFDRISRSIISSIDNDTFIELCQLLPKFSELFPMSKQYVNQRKMHTESMSGSLATAADQTNQATNGSGRNRLLNMINVIFNAICSGGKPVLICVEDLQWADAFIVDIIGDYIVQTAESFSSIFSTADKSPGMMLLGNFRDDEVSDEGFLMNKIRLFEQCRGNIKVTMLSIGELLEEEVNEMLSFKFCLPMRHTQELAQLVYQKTRGHPLFVIAFLRSIVQGDLITYSVKARRWTWDDTTIDLQMISESVAEFLTKKLKQLPSDVIETLNVVSCFGQVNLSTIQLLDLGQFVPNMTESLELAMKEGIIERAGPIFAFSHDMLQEGTYNLVPTDERQALHKKIAMSLVQDPEVSEDTEICTLAVDQINAFKVLGGALRPAECSLFARLNLAAGKYFMSTKKSNYKQARAYFESGISMLHASHWNKQYSLSLELYEWSVVVSFMDGMVEAVSSRLDDILSNARSFDDAMNSHVLKAKFLVSQEQYPAAIDGVREILSNMGEVFPKEINESLVASEINDVIPLLKGVTKESILSLPAMTDKPKLHAMKLMYLLTTFSNITSPMLMHLVSCRMIKLTFSFGLCDDYYIAGLIFVSHGLVNYSNRNDNIWMAAKTSRLAESLMKGNPNEHSLRAVSSLLPAIVCFVEPFQSAVEKCLDGSHSAKIVGDVDSEAYCHLLYVSGSLFTADDLVDQRTKCGFFLQQMAKRKQYGVLHSSMSNIDSFNALIGNNDFDVGIEMKTNKELHQIAERTQSSSLMHQVSTNRMHVHCYFREYLSCASLAGNHQISQTGKRTLDFFLAFYAGIAAFNLARDAKPEKKWREIGQKAVQSIAQLVQYSNWNFENKQFLLQAELNYLDGRYVMAELAYESSILSARDHKFIGEEAMAYELFGIYLVENKKIDRGVEQLEMSYKKYTQWGAFRKAMDVRNIIELVKPVMLQCDN